MAHTCSNPTFTNGAAWGWPSLDVCDSCMKGFDPQDRREPLPPTDWRIRGGA